MASQIDILFSLRPYQSFDAGRIRTLERLCFGAAFTEADGTVFDWGKYTRCTVIDRAKFGVIAFCACAPVMSPNGVQSRKRTQLCAIAVHPEFQRFGYGRYLINDAITDVEYRNVTGILQAYSEQGAAGKDASLFFRKCGFKGRLAGADHLKFEYFCGRSQ